MPHGRGWCDVRFTKSRGEVDIIKFDLAFFYFKGPTDSSSVGPLFFYFLNNELRVEKIGKRFFKLNFNYKSNRRRARYGHQAINIFFFHETQNCIK